MKHSTLVGVELGSKADFRLRRFQALLMHWNTHINLVSHRDIDELWARHILDSAQLGPLLPSSTGMLVDLGSGAGFPGLVLALITEWEVHLVESDQRKAAFLREAVRATGARASVHAVRAEALRLPPADVVTARALAPLTKLLHLAEPLLSRNGICLFPKGRDPAGELTGASNEWHMNVQRISSQTSASATILRISEIRRAGPVI